MKITWLAIPAATLTLVFAFSLPTIAHAEGSSVESAAAVGSMGPGDAGETVALESVPAAADSTAPAPFRIELIPDTEDDYGPREDRRHHFEDGGVDDWWSSTRPPGEFLGSIFRYNRVEGVALGLLTEHPLSGRGFQPRWGAGLGYGFATERGLYQVFLEQPLVSSQKLTLGAAGYRVNDVFFLGNEVIGNDENTASSLFLRKDYRDWYEAEGARAWVGVYPSRHFSLSGGIEVRDERPLEIGTDWAVFSSNQPFRDNPAAEEGIYRAWTASATYDSRPKKKTGRVRGRSGWDPLTHHARLTWERADAGLGGDFDHWRVVFDGRSYLRLSPDQDFTLRVLLGWGESADGSLPIQRRFYLGGLSTMRGHNFKSIEGDRTALVNLLYSFRLFGARRGLILADAGTAWDEGSLGSQKVEVDLGGGIQLGEDGVRFIVARTVNKPDADFRLVMRFQESF